MRETGNNPAGKPLHAVRFYKDADSLCEIVAGFLGDGLAAGHPAIVIATPVHTSGISSRLATRGFDVDEMTRTGELTVADASAMLTLFMEDDLPSSQRFVTAVEPLLERAAAKGTGTTVRAYGEMVDLLWKAGRTTAATRVEMLWNELARRRAFSLLCGYAMGNFYKNAAVEDICRQHSHVYTDRGPTPLT
jgi:hypothetical protein